RTSSGPQGEIPAQCETGRMRERLYCRVMSIWPHIAASASLALAITSLSSPAHAHPPPFYRMPDLSPNSRLGVEVVPTFGEVAGEGALVLDAGLFADIALTPWLVLSGRVPMAYV